MGSNKTKIALLFSAILISHTLWANDREIGSTRMFNLPVACQAEQPEALSDAVSQPAVAEDVQSADVNPLDAIKDKVIKEKRLVSQLDSASFFSLPLGIGGGGEKGDDYAIIIDKATIYPEYAQFSAFMVLTNPMDNKKVRFRADNIKFTFKGGISSNFTLALIDTIHTKLVKDVTLNWMPGTFVEWDCHGFKQIGLIGEVELGEKVFVGVDPATGQSTGKVTTSFYANFADFNNFFLDVSFSPFKIKGFDEAYFTFQNVVLDCSDYGNSPNFVMPSSYKSDYSGDMAPLWRGLYVKNAAVTLSPKFTKSNGAPTSFFAQNLIVDERGFTGICGVENLLSIKEGKLGDWAMSVDKLAIEIRQGAFGSFTLAGGTILPGSTSELKYNAFIDAAGVFKLNVIPGKDITFNAMAAKVVIDNTSSIQVEIAQNKFVPTALLNGTITFGAPKNATSTDATFVKIPGLKFTGMRISAAPPVFDLQYLGFESKEELSFNKFPITITKAAYQKNSDGDAVFQFGVKVNLVPAKEEALTGETEFGLKADLSGPKWKFKGVELYKIAVHAEKKNAYKLDGEVMFADGDPTYGDGFRGKIDATFGKDIKVQALAVFGETSGFRYFLVDAFVCLPDPGITCGPLILNGFGGGLYYKMRQTLPTENVGSEFGKGLSDIIYVPDNSKSIGIKAAIKAAIVKKELVDAKVSFEINFTDDGGIAQIAFTGDAKILTPPTQVSDAQVKTMTQKATQNQPMTEDTGELMRALVSMQMDFEKETYHNTMELYVNIAGVLTGRGANNRAGWSVMHIEPGKWYLHMGTPADPIGLKFVGLMEVGGYFMAGHDIPDAMALPQTVLDILQMSQEDFNGKRKSSTINSGNGLAFGTSFALHTGEKNFLIFYGQFDLGGGYDVLLLDYGKNTHCKGSKDPIGINGWYAAGQAYAYFNGDIGLKVKVFRKKRKFTILKLATAAAMTIEGPNPTWMKGVIGGKYNILGGLVKGNCKFEISMGSRCDKVTDATDDRELDNIAIISDVAPKAGSTTVDVFTLPQVVFNLPVEVAAKISEDPNSTQQFRVKLNQMGVYNGTTLISGTTEWDADKKTLAFTPSTILAPKTKYKIIVKAGFEQKEKINSPWEVYKDEAGNTYNETMEVEFTTGELPDKIPTNYVTYTYPINRMMNFYKNESNTAYVTFKADLLPFFQPQTGWIQKARWTPTGGGSAIYSDIKYVQATKSAETTVPANLSNDKVYSFEFVNVPTSLNNSVARNVTETNSDQLTGEGENSASITTRQAEGVISEAEEKAFYALSFRCSKFNKFFDKFPSSEVPVRSLYNVREAIDNPVATIFGNEMLDGFEIVGTADRPPLVRCEAELTGADWYQNNIYPLMYEGYPLHPTATVKRNTETQGLPPIHPIEIWQLDDTYIMSDTDLASGKHSSRATITHFVNYTPTIWADDYIDIRNKLSNLVSAKTIVSNPQIDKILGTYPWPQVSAGFYPIKIEYRLPGRNTVTSAKTVSIKNNIETKQVNLILND